MRISFVWLYVFICDVYTQLLVDLTQKDFWVIYMFLEVFLCFCVLSFCSYCLFHVFNKNSFRGIFTRRFTSKLFSQKWGWKKLKTQDFRQKLSWQKLTHEKRVFSVFKGLIMTVFQIHTLYLPRASLNLKPILSQKPNKNSSEVYSKSFLRYV